MKNQIDEEETLRIIDEFEERLEKFNKDIDDQNIMYVLVKAHLYIEYELEEILRKYVKYSEHLNLSSMSFSQKENLVLALGIVPDSEKNSLHSINKIRNNFAHNLDYEFDEAILENNIIGQFSLSTKKKYEENLNFYYKKYGDGLGGKLRCAVSIIWGNLLEMRIISPSITHKT